jgi:glycosyltransferase involved in cell wall biosynthesis
VRRVKEINKNNIYNNNSIRIIYEHILKKYHRLLFNLKISQLTKRISETADLCNIGIIHSHFLFSDGAVALELKRKYNIPYIVAVRNTDVNVFFKYMFHLRNKGLNILLNAEHIIFLTPSYVNIVVNNYVPSQYKKVIEQKIVIIPNGLNEFWLRNKAIKTKKKKDLLSVLYVGNFTPNKNVISIIEAIEQLKKEGINIKLNLVGGGGPNSKKVVDRLNTCDNKVIKHFVHTSKKEDLLNYYNDNDIFVMPSFKETFGIVFLEAMSQGLPIIYTKGQGVDGYFQHDSPGYAVNSKNINDLKQKIMLAFDNIEKLSSNSLLHINAFSWDIISKKYCALYDTIANES